LAAGIVSKWDLILELIDRWDPDLFFLAEADIKVNRDLDCFKIAGYQLILSNCYLSKGKARLLVLSKTGRFTELSVHNNVENELIYLKAGNLVVIGGYRPFKKEVGETDRTNFERMISNMNSVDFRKNVLLIGDLNIDLTKKKSRFASELTEWLDDKGLNVVEVGQTRMRRVLDVIQTSSIDLVATNMPNITVETEFNNSSDHCIMIVDIGNKKVQKTRKTKIEFLDWRNYKKEKAVEYAKSDVEPSMFLNLSTTEMDYRIRAILKDTCLYQN